MNPRHTGDMIHTYTCIHLHIHAYTRQCEEGDMEDESNAQAHDLLAAQQAAPTVVAGTTAISS
jgi:hypothetical protein